MKEVEKCKPLNDSILVELLNGGDDTTKSGIIIPAGKKLKARVVKVSDGFYSHDGNKIPLQTKKGDVVLLSGEKNNYQDVTLDGNKYYIASENKIKLILSRE